MSAFLVKTGQAVTMQGREGRGHVYKLPGRRALASGIPYRTWGEDLTGGQERTGSILSGHAFGFWAVIKAGRL